MVLHSPDSPFLFVEEGSDYETTGVQMIDTAETFEK